jgi:Dullard-like phosphatase family protein
MSRQSNRKIKREILEERVKFFMNKQIPNNNLNFLKQKNNNNKSKKFSVAIKEGLINKEKEDKKDKKNNNNNNINTHNKKKLNISSLSTQIQVGNDQNNNKKENQTTSIPIKKEIGKFVEPRFKLKAFQQLSPKFYKSADMSGNLSQVFSHEITNSEFEMWEIDEKLPQKKLEKLEEKRIRNSINISFPFHFLIEIEKCYQEISKDLKSNKNKNLDYKIKMAATYLNILMKEENIIYNLFFYNKDINKFLIRELSIFLSILFLNDFDEIKETDILDFSFCISYCHLNFIFLIMTLVNKTDEEIFTNKNNENINNKDNDIDNAKNTYFYYQHCKTLTELNADKIDLNNFEQNFHNNNKIIKSMIEHLLSNLSYINEKIANNILEIFNLSKGQKITKFKDVINNHIRCNELINEKINKIIRESLSLESKSNLTDDEDSENLPQPDAPYFDPKRPDDKREYCLVLDLDETLVHYFEDENEAYVKVRMGTEDFIRKLSQYCEIAIFTASTQNYADIVIDGLDCKDLIDYRLYRQHTTLMNGVNVKDLSKLGRDMDKIIIIDNIEENYQLQPNNGLNICDFEGDQNDNELEYLLEDLLKLVSQPGKKVGDELPAIRRNMQKRYTNIS